MWFILLLCIIIIIGVVYFLWIRKSSSIQHIPAINLESFVPSSNVLSKKVAILQVSSYTGAEPIYTELGTAINERYCKQWGYDYFFKRIPATHMPIYWIRVDQLLRLSKQPYDFLVWMDLDAVVVDHSIPLPELMNAIGNYAFYASEDPSLDVVANSGVVVIRNNSQGKRMLTEWHSFCFCDQKLCNHCRFWKRNDTTQKWNCKECKVWARFGYEQHAMGELLQKHSEHAIALPRQFLGYHTAGRNFITHLFATSDSIRLAFFQEIAAKLGISGG